jgi:hypothetical protein
LDATVAAGAEGSKQEKLAAGAEGDEQGKVAAEVGRTKQEKAASEVSASTQETVVAESTQDTQVGEPSGPVREGEVVHLERGDSIGRYLVLDELGAGGMGVVYAAYDGELDRKLAIKLLRPAAQGTKSSTDGTSRLLREAQAMAKLSHPNVVTVHDVGTHRGAVFVALEFIDGESLGEWMERGPHSWRDVIAHFLPAGRGLAGAHAAGLVHRDFKPDNVLLGTGGEV